MIPEWTPFEAQYARLGSHSWSVPRLAKLAEDLPVMEIPLAHLYMYSKYEGLTLRDMAMHFKATMDADLSRPIILDEDGDLMDGRHRIMKALVIGAETIKAVRFRVNPPPCKVEGD